MTGNRKENLEYLKKVSKDYKEAEGIKAVADAKAYEVDKAKGDLDTYMKLKQFEIELERVRKWDGKFPYYLMGTGGAGESGTMNMLFSAPTGK